jgi:hypothetical protein
MRNFLIVEGARDKHFVNALLKKINENDTTKIIVIDEFGFASVDEKSEKLATQIGAILT